MSSKFFTWTKGDRHNAAQVLRSEGMVPIPIEWITIKGMDYMLSEKNLIKAKKKPPPLILDGSVISPNEHSSPTSCSIARHEAAVKCATGFMSATDDVFRSSHVSPQLLSAQSQAAEPKIAHYRTRAHTAPSTPLWHINTIEPVELPGSVPINDNNTNNDAHIAPVGPRANSAQHFQRYPNDKLERPHSSPQAETHTVPCRRARMSIESFYHRDTTFAQPTGKSPLLRSNTPMQDHSTRLPAGDVKETRGIQGEQQSKLDMPRSPLLDTSADLGRSPGLSTPRVNSQSGCTQSVPRFVSPRYVNAGLERHDISQGDVDTIVIDNISKIRAAHDSHLKSLKEAHEKEIENYQSYAALLEQKMKLGEEILKNSIADLQQQLVAVDKERADTLTDFHKARSKLRDVSLREQNHHKELQDLHDRVGSCVCGETKPMAQQVQDLQVLICEKDGRIRQLEEVKAAVSSPEPNRIPELERELERNKRLYASAKADSNRYESLLHKELRRQARQSSQIDRASIPQVEARAAVLTKEKVAQLVFENKDLEASMSGTGKTDDVQLRSVAGRLEAELEHCISEIILYKLDVKGYKRDLKDAHAKIEGLEFANNLHLPTPVRDSPSSTRCSATPGSHRRYRSCTIDLSTNACSSRGPGLGISLVDTSMNHRKGAHSTTSPLRESRTPVSASSTLQSPSAPLRRTPIELNKRLPKPPQLATTTSVPCTPPTSVKPQSPEALRSFSDTLVTTNASLAMHKLPESRVALVNNVEAQTSSSPHVPLVPLSRPVLRQSLQPLRSNPVTSSV